MKENSDPYADPFLSLINQDWKSKRHN